MERQLRHLVRLVDDLLDVSRINSGKIELKKERLALNQVLADAVETARSLVEARRHTLQLRVPQECLWLSADATRLTQVFVNLLNNAAKYTPPGGLLRIHASRAGDEAVIAVSDNGAGLPADMIAHVFDLFVQVEHTRAHALGGLGIGLSVVKRLVQMHGGTVTAESEGEGRGSTFTVRLPLLHAMPGDQTPPLALQAQVPFAPIRTRRVMVVDDNRDGADALSAMLQLLGHQTQTVNDPLQAVEEGLRFAPDVVLLDIGMPKLDGYEVARRLRAHPQFAATLLVALTGFAGEEVRQRSAAAGFDLHLLKPVDPGTVQALLAQAEQAASRCGR